MRQRDRESITDSDPHGLLFGPSDEDSLDDSFPDGHTGPLPRVERVTRSELRAARGRRAARSRSRRLVLIMAALLVAVVAVATWLVVLPIYHYFNPSDYGGSGSGSVIVEIKANDTADDIGKELRRKDVVASVKAFTDAAKNDARSTSIQPGSYKLREHMSAKSALGLLLDPSSRVRSDVLVIPGATTIDVLKRLTAPPCPENAPENAVCGPGLNKADVTKALGDVKAIGLPTDFTVRGKTPPSAEGFLYPATYTVSEKSSPLVAIQAMVTGFTDQARKTDFTAQAKALHITPYQELIIASIAQAEAKYPEDYGKVARVILNRLAANRPLQVDATSAYAAKLQGLDPTKVNYANLDSEYNTYHNDGLPPTPISNPGADAMAGAAHPDKGNWLFYVNGDKDGHLVFMSSEAAFARAKHTCAVKGWGCSDS